MGAQEGHEGSRLQKLLRLIKEGKTEDIRKAAAEQIAGVAKNQPSQLFTLVTKVTEALLGKQWEGRIAASYCLELISKHCQHHDVNSMKDAFEKHGGVSEDVKMGSGGDRSDDDDQNWLRLETFDIKKVMDQAKPLAASSGVEFNVGSLQDQQSLQQQKKHLKARLGLDGISGQIISTDDFIADEDLEIDVKAEDGDKGTLASTLLEGLSARERALARAQKRKNAGSEGPGSGAKKMKTDDTRSNMSDNERINQTNLDMWADATAGAWPFERISDKLCIDLLHPSWETRHGAALGLRSILQHHSASAGVYAAIEDTPTGWLAAEGNGRPSLLPMRAVDINRAIKANICWLEECIVHILCVLALERFGDYISDEVVAPVRETSAQVLGILAASMPEEMFLKTMDALAIIAQADHWESRHGALSGLKYALIAREDIDNNVFSKTLEIAQMGLKDTMEDVRSVSAECLIPCVERLSRADPSVTGPVVDLLWDSLLSLDPLNTATKSASKLLENMFSQSIEETKISLESDKIPRLWYHFSSKTSSIRSATIRCYQGIIASSFDKEPSEFHLIGLFACLHTIITDESNEIARLAYETCLSLLHSLEKNNAYGQSLHNSVWDSILEMAMFTPGKRYDRPKSAELPQIDNLVDEEEMCLPACVQRPNASERRYLVCGVASQLGSHPNLRKHATDVLISYAVGLSGLRRQIAAMILCHWSTIDIQMVPAELVDSLVKALSDKRCLNELSRPFMALSDKIKASGIEGINVSTCQEDVLQKAALDKGLSSGVISGFVGNLSSLRAMQDNFNLSVSSCLASGIVQSERLPEKLNNIIQPLIAGIRREKDEFLQHLAARSIAKLVWLTRSRTPSPGGKIIKNLCTFACSDKSMMLDASKPDTEATEASVGSLMSKGGMDALKSLAELAASNIEDSLPQLWNLHISGPLKAERIDDISSFQPAIQACFLLKGLCPCIVDYQALDQILKNLVSWLKVDNMAVQTSVSTALSCIIAKDVSRFLPGCLGGLGAILKDGSLEPCRFGGIIALRNILTSIGTPIIPYVPLIVVYIMRRMSDSSQRVRSLAAQSFAIAVTLMPLAQGADVPQCLSDDQKEMVKKDGNFLEQLLNNEHVDDYKLPFELLTGSLRRYQQEGINWLAFLKRFGLHGVLADDMGLGKTLQSSAIIGAASYERQTTYEKTKDPSDAPKASLVVCPATLVSHWPHEISKFVSSDVLKPVRVHGTPAERQSLYKTIEQMSVVVISYETLRSDIDILKKKEWLYIVLDEGHAIRNPTSKLAQAARELNGMHRLILSGTPVQNSVLEVWAMFEFLMPGYLGDRKSFNSKYGKSVERAKKSSKESTQAQASILALQALHKQVMPFILRRTKDQVLKDLPPKIIQDIICDPSKLQSMLLKDFDGNGIEETLKSMDTKSDTKGHVFQALHFLRKLCSHPLFVLNKDNEAHIEAVKACLGDGAPSNWEDAVKMLGQQLEHSPKLSALKELLTDCGIGLEDEEAQTDLGHRVLVFAQTKAMLNLVESAVLKPMGVSHLRIDGDVDALERFNVVQKFNADPTIDVMLLTTSVGGLGLNLTSADTVIFMEHDWNPQKDLQAMDRAHRLGQKRSVNVYRLLVRGTLEESIMSLQQFKLDVAASVVNADNMSMKDMDTGSLLDLFTNESEGDTKTKQAPKKGLSAILADLPSLDEMDAQYASEFDASTFKTLLQKHQGSS